MLLFTLGATFVAGLLAGLAPAVHASKPNLVADLRGHALEHILREVLRRRLQLNKRLELVDVAVIEILHHFIRRSFKLHKVYQ